MLVKDRRGDFYAVRRAGWSDLVPQVECWPGPKLPPKMCERARLEVARCGAVLVDIGGRFDCMPVGVKIISGPR
jgi:hypothetical protein